MSYPNIVLDKSEEIFYISPFFKKILINENLSTGIPHYMGCAHPAAMTNPYDSFKYIVCKQATIASGCGYMVSKPAMKVH
jgi:hypothetical protein